MKKSLVMLFLCINLFADNFNDLVEKTTPIDKEKHYIEEDLLGHWNFYSINSADGKNHFYNEESLEPLSIYFSSIRSTVQIETSSVRPKYFVFSNKISIGNGKMDPNGSSKGLMEAEDYKIVGKYKKENKDCLVLLKISSIFEKSYSAVMCKNGKDT